MVDCNHYVSAFNLSFYKPEKVDEMRSLNLCLNAIKATNFQRYCKTTCERIKYSKVTTLMEGDFDFLIETANYFYNFYFIKESGSFVSPSLRKIFKSFIPERMLKRGRRTNLRRTKIIHIALKKKAARKTKEQPIHASDELQTSSAFKAVPDIEPS